MFLKDNTCIEYTRFRQRQYDQGLKRQEDLYSTYINNVEQLMTRYCSAKENNNDQEFVQELVKAGYVIEKSVEDAPLEL